MPELPESHYQRKKRLWRFLSNANFDLMAAQAALIQATCLLTGINGHT